MFKKKKIKTKKRRQLVGYTDDFGSKGWGFDSRYMAKTPVWDLREDHE